MLFEFRCKKCDTITEAITKGNVKEVECSKCGAKAEKIVSAPHFHIHGFSAANGYSNEKVKKPKGG